MTVYNRTRYKSVFSSSAGHSIGQYFQDRFPSCSDGIADRLVTNNGPYNKFGGRLEVMHDVVTPGFSRMSRSGTVLMNPMQRTISEYTSYGSSLCKITENSVSCSGSQAYIRTHEYRPTGYGWNMYAGWADRILSPTSIIGPPSIIPGTDINSAVGEATTSCLAKRGSPGNNLWETVAEARKSTRLLGDLMRSATEVVGNNSLVRRAKSASSAYLLLRYGLGPIIKDVESIKKGLLKKTGLARVTSRGKSDIERFQVTSREFSYNNIFYPTIQDTISEEFRVRAMSLDELTADMWSNIGFTDKGLITLPWELIPYSFVVDWFVNIGDFLNALVPMFSVRQLGSCLVIEQRFSVLSTFTSSRGGSGYTVSTAPTGTCLWVHEVKRRIPNIGGPSIRIKADFGFDRLVRVADAVALAVQRLGGRR